MMRIMIVIDLRVDDNQFKHIRLSLNDFNVMMVWWIIDYFSKIMLTGFVVYL